MDTPTGSTDTQWLLEVHARLIDLGYATDEYVSRQVAAQFTREAMPSESQLHAAVGRAEVVRALQESFT